MMCLLKTKSLSPFRREAFVKKYLKNPDGKIRSSPRTGDVGTILPLKEEWQK